MDVVLAQLKHYVQNNYCITATLFVPYCRSGHTEGLCNLLAIYIQQLLSI